MIFIIVIAVIFVFFAIISGFVKGVNGSKTRQRVASQYGANETFVSDIDGSFVAINFGKQQVIFGKKKYESSYSFNQIASVEVIANESSVTQTNRGSQLLGTAVGVVALGGIGAILGGLSASKTSKSRLKSLTLKIIVDDQRQPVYSIPFFRSANGSDPNGLFAKPAFERIERMHAQFVLAMRKAQSATVVIPTTKAETFDSNALRHLESLWDLKSKGILSEEEFTSQKALLLGSHEPVRLPAPTPRWRDRPRTVTVTYCGDNKIAAIEAIREVTGLGLVESKKIVDSSLPVVLDISPEVAESVRQKLAAAGVTVNVG